MKFTCQLARGRLVKRYKRFLADVELDDGAIVTTHCPNPGSMRTCATAGWEVRLSRSNRPGRKLPYTWEMVYNGDCWIGINTQVPNKIVEEALNDRRIPELTGYESIGREVRFGEHTRFDFALFKSREVCYVEVKNVTLVEDDGIYRFPDAVTSRGRRHLRELTAVVKGGNRAVMLYVIQRSDGGSIFAPASHIDPEYAEALTKAHAAGVEILPYLTHITEHEIQLTERIDFSLDSRS